MSRVGEKADAPSKKSRAKKANIKSAAAAASSEDSAPSNQMSPRISGPARVDRRLSSAIKVRVPAGTSDTAASATPSATAQPAATPQPGNPMEVLGAATWLLAQTPQFCNMPIGALEALIGVPYRLGQLRLYRNKGRPFAVAAWAYVSEEVEKRIQNGGEGLKPEEWKCGDRPWLMLLAAPHGGRDVVQAELGKSLFGGEAVMVLAHENSAPHQRKRADGVYGPEQSFAGKGVEKLEVISNKEIEGARELIIGEAHPGFVENNKKEIVNLVRALLTGPHYRPFPVEDGKILETASRIVEWEDGIFIAALVNNQLVGAVVGGVEKSPFNSLKFVRDYFFAIDPAFRNNDIEQELLSAFEAKAKSVNAMYMQISHSSGINPKAADELYRSIGAHPIGTMFRKSFSK